MPLRDPPYMTLAEITPDWILIISLALWPLPQGSHANGELNISLDLQGSGMPNPGSKAVVGERHFFITGAVIFYL